MAQHRSTPTHLSRRRLMQAGGALGASLLITDAWSGTAAGADAHDFAGIRKRWRDLLTGGADLDPSVPEVRAALDALDSRVSEYVSTMDRSDDRTYLWPEWTFDSSDPFDNSRALQKTYERLRDMTLAWATIGSATHGDADALATTVDGLEWMDAHHYNTTVKMAGNWYNWRIGVPLGLVPTVLLLRDELTDDQADRYLNAVDRFCSKPNYQGANLVWTCHIVATRGALVKDGAKIALARERLPEALAVVTSGNGIYDDGSMIQHAHHPYTGGYGLGLLRHTSSLAHLLAGTPWAVDGDALGGLTDFVEDGFEPWLFRGALLSAVRGRSIARSGDDDHDSGGNLARSLVWLARAADAEHADHFKSIVKQVAQDQSDGNLYDSNEFGTIVAAKAIAEDSSITPPAPLDLNKQYWNMDRAVHRRPAFAYSVSMSSSRVYTYESINDENIHGWHTGSGMTMLYNDDLAHYSDGYWATVDPKRLPGTTVPTTVPEHVPGEPGVGSDFLSASKWAGGLAHGSVGFSALQARSFPFAGAAGDAPLSRTSYFMIDDVVVVTGAWVHGSSGERVESIVENRRLVAGGDQTFVVDGTSQGAAGWVTTFDSPTWAHLTGGVETAGIGYVFGPGVLHGKRELREGRWTDINLADGTDDTPMTHEYVTLWYDHGVDPNEGTYEYTVLPGTTPEEVAAYADSPSVEILSNTRAVQAVQRDGVVAANFWELGAGVVGGIECRGRAAVLVAKEDGHLTVKVSDPTHVVNGTVELTLQERVASAVSVDPEVRVDSMDPLVLTVELTGTGGAPVTATFELA